MELTLPDPPVVHHFCLLFIQHPGVDSYQFHVATWGDVITTSHLIPELMSCLGYHGMHVDTDFSYLILQDLTKQINVTI